MKRTYQGGCHCGALRFEADIDLSEGTGKCNCSYCAKVRQWLARTAPEAFRLKSENGALSEYRGGNEVAHHFFCARCGIHTHDRVDIPNGTGRVYVNVMVACLEDVSVDNLVAAPLRYFDGRNDTWGETPAEVRHL